VTALSPLPPSLPPSLLLSPSLSPSLPASCHRFLSPPLSPVPPIGNILELGKKRTSNIGNTHSALTFPPSLAPFLPLFLPPSRPPSPPPVRMSSWKCLPSL
jgi:hypothetical protein